MNLERDYPQQPVQPDTEATAKNSRPEGLSWAVIGGILRSLFQYDGMINDILISLGMERIMFLGSNTWFPIIAVVSDVWKDMGYNMIIFLAAITNVDPALYESAALDGANRWQQTWHITLQEAAVIDGASQMQVLFRVYLPLSLPSLATIILFATVANWNVWMDGYLYMNTPDKYPLQTYLATILMESKNNVETLMTPEQLERMSQISEKTIEAAQIFLGALPIMCVYPFLQRYYVKGLVVGSVKG